LAARSFTAPSVAPGPTRIERDAASTSPIPASRERSTITPSPIAPPAIELPDPRGTRGTPVSADQRRSVTTSSASAGTATARGMIRWMPAASL